MKKDSVNLLESIFLILAELRVAIDRKTMADTDDGRRWKKEQIDKMFNLRWGSVVAEIPTLKRKMEEQKMRNKWVRGYERIITRQNKVLALFKMVSDCVELCYSGLIEHKFGCIVLLDPIWSPIETSSVDFHHLHSCILSNVLTRPRRNDDDVEYEEDVPWHLGNDMGNRNMLVEVVRYFTTDAIANFVDSEVGKLEKEAAEVAA